MYAFVVFLAFILFYIVLEILARKTSVNTEVTRKIAHLLSGIGTIIGTLFITRSEFLVLTAIFTLLFIISRICKFQKSIYLPGKSGLGEIYYPIALFIIGYFYFTNREIFVPAVLLIAIPDTVAWGIGYIKKAQHKSIAGSIGYLFAALLILACFYSLPFSLAIGIILTVVEFFSRKGTDNITIPLVFLACLQFFK